MSSGRASSEIVYAGGVIYHAVIIVDYDISIDHRIGKREHALTLILLVVANIAITKWYKNLNS